MASSSTSGTLWSTKSRDGAEVRPDQEGHARSDLGANRRALETFVMRRGVPGAARIIPPQPGLPDISRRRSPQQLDSRRRRLFGGFGGHRSVSAVVGTIAP